MKILVTGGAGFIGRWVVQKLLGQGHLVYVLDDFSNSSPANLAEFQDDPNLTILVGDVSDFATVSRLLAARFAVCLHLAARINVQSSIDSPGTTFAVDVGGTYNVLEAARRTGTKVVFVSTCMVYAPGDATIAINEEHPRKPASPYAGAKLAAEALVQSYFYAYGLPTVILRPFNTYGPFQRADAEGGVVAIFVKRFLEGRDLEVFGDGWQTRDLLYVEDCAEFITRAAFCERAHGEILNASTGRDIAIRELALLIAGMPEKIRFVPHRHPQSEIKKLAGDYSKAKNLFGWQPKTSLEEGIAKTLAWFKGGVACG